MAESQESSYAPAASGAGPQFRTIQVPTVINGVPTQVAVEAILLTDADGNLLVKFIDADFQAAVLARLDQLITLLARLANVAVGAT